MKVCRSVVFAALACLLADASAQSAAAIQAKAAAATKARVRLQGTGDTLTCFSHAHRCIVPVYVRNDGATRCKVSIAPDTIVVPKRDASLGQQPIRIIWVLRQADKDTKIAQYAFASSTGVKPIDGNQPTDQFDFDGHDGAYGDNPNAQDDVGAEGKRKRFRLTSKHPATGLGVRYVVDVIRKVGSDLNVCDMDDPLIVNADN